MPSINSVRRLGAAATEPLGVRVLTGADSAEKFANDVEALEAGRLAPAIVVARG